MTVPERMDRSQDPEIGLVGFPLDRDELLRLAESKLSRELTEEKCRQFLGLGSCDERLAELAGTQLSVSRFSAVGRDRSHRNHPRLRQP